MDYINLTSKFKMSHGYYERRTLHCSNCDLKVGEKETDDDVSWTYELNYKECPNCKSVFVEVN
jgi:Zn finger protein HypA/HybF involved in hydrogenase expression